MDLTKRINRIIAACKQWNSEFNVPVPSEIAERKKISRSLRTLIKIAIGLLVFPPSRVPRRIILFQGLRSEYVFSLFPRENVYILGSRIEQEYARSHGYGFIPTFPIENSVRLAAFYSLFMPAKMHLRRWQRWIENRDITVFLYEDTQPIGAFLSMLVDQNNPSYRAICLQHGHFSLFTFPIRLDGHITEYNMVWDIEQAKMISDFPKKTAVKGLPYTATAKFPWDGQLRVIFVGTGHIAYYKDTIQIFNSIAINLRNEFKNILIAYRPHPTEFIEPQKISEVKGLFGCIDTTPKIDLLNGPWTLFIGEVSSVLYEAKQSGHLTATVPIDPKNIALEYPDITISPDDIRAFFDNLRGVLANPPPLALNRAADGDPVLRFISAIRELGLESVIKQHE